MDGRVTGTCQALERGYLRTAPSRSEDIRPKDVLQKSLQWVAEKAGGMGEGRYGYLMSQLKAMRQELTVQGIDDGFAIEVYEMCLKEALNAGDRGEYTVCHAALKELGNNGHILERLLFQALAGDQFEDLNTEVCEQVAAGTRSPVFDFITASYQMNPYLMRAAHDAMSPAHQQVYRTFSHKHRTLVFEVLLKAAGPTKIDPVHTAQLLILPPDTSLESFLTTVCGLSPPPMDAKPLLEGLQIKRTELKRT
eukprot:TRINITY_DN1917_c0_g2_i5.p1 TRINITY_DN1917_c0_g2~~TRINITY_DN1917_c0_g2_i5.p1  ORF type:complete len:251 (+),score=47.38 TRINITY_DN1917_c0_g2_i5:130-882(+)